VGGWFTTVAAADEALVDCCALSVAVAVQVTWLPGWSDAVAKVVLVAPAIVLPSTAHAYASAGCAVQSSLGLALQVRVVPG
jgi:hypothetical protein